jgi:Na+/glutamate symporter
MVLFNPVKVCEEMRTAIMANHLWDLKFWIGTTIIFSICTILCGLVASFTAWGMVSALSDDNVHCVLRSSTGMYVCELPHRLVLSSLYLFR